MSDYMFMLESHLSTDQFRVVGELQAIAGQAGVNLFLTGGAMRDMLGGFPVRDLDFTVEGSAAKLAKVATQKSWNYGDTFRVEVFANKMVCEFDNLIYRSYTLPHNFPRGNSG